MPHPNSVLRTPEDELQRTLNVWEACDRNNSETARRLGIHEKTVRRQIKRGLELNLKPSRTSPLEFPDLPSDRMPDDELLDLMCRQFRRRHDVERAKRWFPVKVKMDGPIGVTWFGDPHVDSNGCNWPLLREHARIVSETEGMFGANIGDTTDNWIGRLSRLYMHSDQSRETAIQLAEILISKLGIEWLLLIRGNHDMWSGSSKDDPMTWMRRGAAPYEDWQARLRLVFPNGREARIWAAHNFPGHSQYHGLHGPLKAARMKAEAHLYVSGHTHNWSLFQDESAERGFVFWLARARGYKFIDEHSEMLGHSPQQEGASIVSIFDPEARSDAGFVQCFADVGEAAEYLNYKRRKAAA